MSEYYPLPTEWTCRNRKGEPIRILLRTCNMEDLKTVMELQDRVLESMEDRTLFVRTSEEEIAESLCRDFCPGAFYENRMILCSVMIRNRVSERNLGFYLGYDDERQRKTVTFDTVFVDPDFRGYSLQNLAFRVQEKAAVEFGAEEALLTIAPENVYSLRNAEACGFEAVKRMEMYGGYDRFILRKLFSSSSRCGNTQAAL